MNNHCDSHFIRCPVRAWHTCPLWIAPPLLLLLVLPGPCWGMTRFDDPEDSPLFADSRQKAFEQFAARDSNSLAARDTARGATPYTGEIIVVEGTRAQKLGAVVSPVPGAGGFNKGPVPLSVTTDITCGGGFTCVTSCNGQPTCRGQPTCDAGCVTYNGGLTCLATCRGATCGGPTCPGVLTCSGATCYGGPTCTPTQCPTTLAVTVPQAGQIQMSFSSSTALQYSLQYCSNLSSNQWLMATNARGNGGIMTFFHTNNASRSFYRLLISQ